LGATGGAAAAPTASAAAPSPSPSQQQLPTALCLYHFPGEVEGDLALQVIILEAAP